jgi:hypothetical protein
MKTNKLAKLLRFVLAVGLFSAINSYSQSWGWDSNISGMRNVPYDYYSYGNVLVAGNHGFDQAGDTAVLFLGDKLHYIKSTFGSGVRIGTYLAQDAIQVQETTGNVGIGTTNPTVKLDVRGAIATDGNTGDNGGIKWIVVQGYIQNGQHTLGINYPGNKVIPQDKIIGISGSIYYGQAFSLGCYASSNASYAYAGSDQQVTIVSQWTASGSPGIPVRVVVFYQ